MRSRIIHGYDVYDQVFIEHSFFYVHTLNVSDYWSICESIINVAKIFQGDPAERLYLE